MIEIFFKHGKNRLIATGVFSVITMIPSFIIKILKSKDWKISLIIAIPWFISTWSRSEIGHGFSYAIHHYDNHVTKAVFYVLLHVIHV